MRTSLVVLPAHLDPYCPSPDIVLDCAKTLMHSFNYLECADRWKLWTIFCSLLEKIDQGQDPPQWSEGEIQALLAALGFFRQMGMCHTVPQRLFASPSKSLSPEGTTIQEDD